MGRTLAGRERARRVFRTVGLATGALALVCALPLRADDFNEERLQEGRIAYQQKKFTEAIDQFRVAAFGSLDRPVVLSECIARLALAQAAAGKSGDADETLNRFLEVERRFGTYAKTNLEPEVRSDFRALLVRRIPPAALAAVGSLAETEPLPPSRPARPATAAASKAPRAPAPTVAAPASPSAGASAPTVAERSRDALTESRRRVLTGRAADAERLLSDALQADPGNRQLRLALLEASCLDRSYAQAVAQVPLVAPFGEAETASMFYAAMALYETGRRAEARDYMQRASASVSGPLVDEYAKKIMGGQP